MGAREVWSDTPAWVRDLWMECANNRVGLFRPVRVEVAPTCEHAIDSYPVGKSLLRDAESFLGIPVVVSTHPLRGRCHAAIFMPD